MGGFLFLFGCFIQRQEKCMFQTLILPELNLQTPRHLMQVLFFGGHRWVPLGVGVLGNWIISTASSSATLPLFPLFLYSMLQYLRSSWRQPNQLAFKVGKTDVGRPGSTSALLFLHGSLLQERHLGDFTGSRPSPVHHPHPKIGKSNIGASLCKPATWQLFGGGCHLVDRGGLQVWIQWM